MCQDTKALDGGILANTLDGDIDFVAPVAFDLQSFCRTAELVHVAVVDGTNQTEGDRCRIVTFLVSIEDGLESRAGGGCSLLVGYHVAGDGLGGVGSHVKHACSALQ